MGGLDGLPALAELYDQHARPLHRYLARRVGAEVADDLVGEAFLVLWEQRHRYDSRRASPRAWLYGLATNLLRGHVRAEVRRLRAWARHEAQQVPGSEVGSRVADIADAGTLASRLTEAVARLRAEERNVLLLVAWGDLTPTEIAEVLDIPVGTVRSRLHRARTRLRGLVIEMERNPREATTDLEANRNAR